MNRKAFFIFIVIFSFQFISCIQEIKERVIVFEIKFKKTIIDLFERDSIFENIIQPTTFHPDEFSEQGRVYYYIKVFGLMKYCTNEKINHNINTRFLQNYETIKNATNREQFNNLINEVFLLSNFDNVNNTNIDWLNNTTYFDDNTINHILTIYSTFMNSKNSCLSQNNIGLVKVKDKDKPQDFDSLFPSEATRIWGLANYWNYINYFWVYKPLMDANWDSVLYSQIPNFIVANDAKEYNLAVLKLVAFTDDNHSILRSEIIANEIFGSNIPNFKMKKIDDIFVVKECLTNRTYTPSDTLIKPGDIIHAINGVAVNELYDSLKNYVASSNEWTKSRNINFRILRSLQKNNQITFSRNCKTDTVNLTYFHYHDYLKYKESIENKQNQLPVIIKKETGYVHIDDIHSNNFNKTMKELSKAKNIILDVRGYPNKNVSSLLVYHLLPPNTNFFKSTYPDIHNQGFIKVEKGHVVGKKHAFVNKRIVVLVDETTQSAAEFLVMALQQLNNVTTIGSYTSGADGNVIIWNFPGKIESYLSGIGILYPDNTITQRKGIKIDYIIEPTVEDYQAGKDAILDYAYSFLE